MFSIITLPDWGVRTEWLGATRIVFTGSLFDCLRFTGDLA